MYANFIRRKSCKVNQDLETIDFWFQNDLKNANFYWMKIKYYMEILSLGYKYTNLWPKITTHVTTIKGL